MFDPTTTSIDEEAAARLIARAFPELAPTRARAIGSGHDNLAFLVNGAWVFRFPRREDTAFWLEHEILVMPALGPKLPIETSTPHFIARASAEEVGFAAPFAGYRYLEGESADRVRPSDRALIAMAEPLADFLRALHRAEIAIEGDAPGDVIGKSDGVRNVARIEKTLAGVDEDLRPRVMELAHAWSRAQPWRGRPCWVHGDLYPRHLLVDRARRLCAVIDWGDVHAGDPALDLSLALGFLPERGQRAFFARYGEVDRDTMDRARLRALVYGAFLSTHAIEAGDPDFARVGRAYLDRILSL
jgi:aminoglycoside phosphotransferase (APT) family kinase protein